MELFVEPIADPLPDARAVEVVERKGIGHPDTICDAVAEEVSRALSRHYLERFGRILHHNVDKVLLCAGASVPRFGGGQITEPIEIILGGRATAAFGEVSVPVETIAVESTLAWLRAHLHALDPDRHVRVTCRIRPGSADLVDLFGRGRSRAVLANDTSIGIGFAPLSPLETTVLHLERLINGPGAKRERPETGEDVKVMGVRRKGRSALTVACAFISAHIESAVDYLQKKERLAAFLREGAIPHLGDGLEVTVNAADDPQAGSLYLTVTGTSAEAGDDGEVGRGNRANGLITPGRPMTLEAAAGKNPLSHVGKLYNVVAGRIAREIVANCADVAGAECALVSRIGAPIDEPQVAGIGLAMRGGRSPSELAGPVAEIARAGLASLSTISDELVAGTVDLY